MRTPYIPSEHQVKGLNAAPSKWMERFCPLFASGGSVLDVACGAGRNARLFSEKGFQVTGVDIDERCRGYLESLQNAKFVQADIEEGPWPFAAESFDVVEVSFYLYRDLLPKLAETVKPGGYLIYETFMMPFDGFDGNRAKNPDFVLKPLELVDVFRDSLEIVAYEESLLEKGDCVQRFVGRKNIDGINRPVLVP